MDGMWAMHKIFLTSAIGYMIVTYYAREDQNETGWWCIWNMVEKSS